MLLRAEDGFRGRVIDLDTNRRVPKVLEINPDTGYVKALHVVEQNDEHPELEEVQYDAEGNERWYVGQGRFKIVEKPPAATGRVVMGAERCAICSSPLTLPGDDLCPRCRANDRLQRNRFVVERLTTPLLDRQCERCTRTATCSVADEVDVTPEKSCRILWERGMTVGRRYYCDSCYQPARLLDPKGEVIQDFAYAGPDVSYERDRFITSELAGQSPASREEQDNGDRRRETPTRLRLVAGVIGAEAYPAGYRA